MTHRWATTVAVLAILLSGRASATGPWWTYARYTSRSAELYNPASGTWSEASPMATPRVGHGALVLPSGEVLVAGGSTFYDQSAELYEPDADIWTAVAPASVYINAIVPLPSGSVLAVGQRVLTPGTSPPPYGPGAAQIFDGRSRTWSAVEDTPLGQVFVPHLAVTLASGEVVATSSDAAAIYREGTGWRTIAAPPFAPELLVALGTGGALAFGSYVATAIYDPTTDAWSTAAAFLNDTAASLSVRHAIDLRDGTVLAAADGHTVGPWGNWFELGRFDRYDPATDVWTQMSADLDAPLVLLASGRALRSGSPAFGGYQAGPVLSAAAIFDPIAIRWDATASMIAGRALHTATVLQDGRVLVTGGIQDVLIVEPPTAQVDAGGRVYFTAKGGVGFSGTNRSWTLVQNESGATFDPTTGEYVAGCGNATVPAVDSIQVADATPSAAALATVTVRPSALALSPSTATAASGASIAFTSSCGGSTNTWSLATNASGATIDAATGTYVAGVCAGDPVTDVVRVTIANGRTAVAAVNVDCPGRDAPRAVSSGGCASGSGGASWMTVVAVAALATRFRRRARV